MTDLRTAAQQALAESEPTTAWGKDQGMAIAAVRYCLGRKTYVVEDCADWLIANWARFDPKTKHIIQRDVEVEFALDDDARDAGSKYLALGTDADRQQWERVRKLWEKEI